MESNNYMQTQLLKNWLSFLLLGAVDWDVDTLILGLETENQRKEGAPAAKCQDPACYGFYGRP